jgi:hypothetical protein
VRLWSNRTPAPDVTGGRHAQRRRRLEMISG